MDHEIFSGVMHMRPPEEAELLAVAQQAEASHLHLVTDGQRTFLTPIVLPGWQKLAVRVKDAA